MRSAQGLAVRAALACALLASVGCFRPKILSYGYRCGDSGACPDNFTCDKLIGYCLQSGTDAGAPTGTGGKGGQGGQAGKPGTGGTGAVDAGAPDRPCTGQVAMATCPQADAGTGTCDPVCNTGCGQCYQKCSVSSSGGLTCNDLYNPNPNNPQSDASGAAGLLRFNEPSQSFGRRPTTARRERSVSLVAPAQGAVTSSVGQRPIARAEQVARAMRGPIRFVTSRQWRAIRFRPRAYRRIAPRGLSCYLSSGGHTICDCQFDRVGSLATSTGRPGDPCNHSRDCLSGSVCLNEIGFFEELLQNLPVARRRRDRPQLPQWLYASAWRGWWNAVRLVQQPAGATTEAPGPMKCLRWAVAMLLGAALFATACYSRTFSRAGSRAAKAVPVPITSSAIW